MKNENEMKKKLRGGVFSKYIFGATERRNENWHGFKLNKVS